MPDYKQSILDKINSTAAKTEAARQRKKNKGSPASFAAIWNDAVPKELRYAPTVKMMAMLARAVNRVTHDKKNARSFIEWSVENWRIVGQSQFGKMADYPQEPALPFFVKTVDRYYFAYCSRDKIAVRLDNQEKAQVESKRQSSRDADKIAALTKENEALKKQIAELQRVKTRRIADGFEKKDLPEWRSTKKRKRSFESD